MPRRRIIIIGGVAGGRVLRARLNDLPKDREIIPYCRSGQRSYYASRILLQHGFRVRNLSGSYRTWWTATHQD